MCVLQVGKMELPLHVFQVYKMDLYLYVLQVCKIELSQKSLLLDNLKAEYMSKVEELEEKLSEAKHQKQMLQVRKGFLFRK